MMQDCKHTGIHEKGVVLSRTNGVMFCVLGLADRFEEYPKLRELIRLKVTLLVLLGRLFPKYIQMYHT